MGGYVAACALRAAGAASGQPRAGRLLLPLPRGRTVRVRSSIVVEPRRVGRNASSQRVEVTQEGRPILDAMVWSAGERRRGWCTTRPCPPRYPIRTIWPPSRSSAPGQPRATYPFWQNLAVEADRIRARVATDGTEAGSLARVAALHPDRDVRRPVGRRGPDRDPGRPAELALRAPPPRLDQPRFIAPSLDLHVSFQSPTAGEEWLLCDGEAPLSAEGLFAWRAQLWSPGGRLHASGGGQCLYRPLPD